MDQQNPVNNDEQSEANKNLTQLQRELKNKRKESPFAKT